MARKKDPWRQVEHIKTESTRAGKKCWVLTLNCGHMAVRYWKSLTYRIVNGFTFAPKKVRCILCGE